MKSIALFLLLCHGLTSEARATGFMDLPKKQTTPAKYCTKTTSNDLCIMTFDQATNYCQSQGARLPTIRELAQIGVQLGAKGITEVNADVAGSRSEQLIQVLNFDGSYDRFFYSNDAVRSIDFALTSLWSSSVIAQLLENGKWVMDPDHVYGLSLSNAFIGDPYSIRDELPSASVRCVSAR